jgi:hydrogenase/urease accessory protein HupE
MAVLVSAVALIGNLIVDWLRHATFEPVEFIGASIIGIVLALGFRTERRKL